MESVGEFDDLAVLATLQLAADATGVERVGILGFCMGGMWALKASMTGRFDRGGVVLRDDPHARAVAEPHPARRHRLRHLAGSGARARAGGHRATRSCRSTDIADLQAADAEVVLYEGADHGFVHDASRPTHRPEDAADAWARAITFLDRP